MTRFRSATAALPSLLLFAALAACSDRSPVAPADAAPRSAALTAAASGRYVVVLEDGADPRSVAAVAGVRPRHVYTAAITGFAAELNAGQLQALRHNPRVAYVEPDVRGGIATTQFNPPSWGINRIDDPDLPMDLTYVYTSAGSGVTAYVLDTGINRTHQEFASFLFSRASYLPNGSGGDFVGDGHGNAEDCHGHGSHVAGTIGGTDSGVAKQVRLVAARVVDCFGYGGASMVIAAMDWIAAHGKKPAVVNMSLGYPSSTAMRQSATSLVDAGFFVAVAAGNGNALGVPQNACTVSPANAGKAMTVGATTSLDHEASFSNYGTCVDILAPGVGIHSAWIGSSSATNSYSGTSMASPHVAGVAAQYLSLYPSTPPLTVTAALKNLAVPNTTTLHASSVSGGTPNRFLFTNY